MGALLVGTAPDTTQLYSQLHMLLANARDMLNSNATYCFSVAIKHLHRGDIEASAWWAGHGIISMECASLAEGKVTS